MPPKKAATNPADGPTPAEGNFFLSILLNNSTEIKVDWDVIAAECGYNGAATAKKRFQQMLSKHRGLRAQNNNGEGGSAATSPTAPTAPTATPSKGKRKSAGNADDEDSDSAKKTPSKKPRTPRKKAAPKQDSPPTDTAPPGSSDAGSPVEETKPVPVKEEDQAMDDEA